MVENFFTQSRLNEAQEFLQKILEENNWKDKTALILNSKLKQKFKNFEWQTTKNINDGYFLFTTCEYSNCKRWFYYLFLPTKLQKKN